MSDAAGRHDPQDDVQDENGVRAAYDEVADTYADHFRSTEPEAPVELAMVAHFASLLAAPRRVLDAGCGAGRMMPVLAGLGCDVEGVDLSEGMVRRARADHPEFPAQVASLAALPFEDARFDGVFSWYSTIHNPDADLDVIAGELRRVVRPGGHVLVAFQSGAGVTDVSENYRRRGHDVRLLRYLRTPDEMAARLRAAGLVEVARLVRAAGEGEKDDQTVLVTVRPAP